MTVQSVFSCASAQEQSTEPWINHLGVLKSARRDVSPNLSSAHLQESCQSRGPEVRLCLSFLFCSLYLHATSPLASTVSIQMLLGEMNRRYIQNSKKRYICGPPAPYHSRARRQYILYIQPTDSHTIHSPLPPSCI